MKEYRIEKDVIGQLKVPSSAYYGIFTQRAYENFPISGIKINTKLNKSIIEIKMAAAQANMHLQIIDKRTGNAIIKAAQHLLTNYSMYQDQFIVDIYQAGAGTPWNMNVNEVIANLALEINGEEKGNYKLINPHDHVNKAQSSNDVIPTAIRISCAKLANELDLELKSLIHSLSKKSHEFSGILKSGRTHLQDAVPITLGLEFHAWASDLEKRYVNLNNCKKNIYSLHIGGTAIGTGLNAHPKFPILVVDNLKKQTDLPFIVAKDKIEQTQFMSDFLDLSSVLRTISTDLIKISNDVRLLSSGPNTGLNEIYLPQVEPGSSIMPSKFNPSIPEMLNMVCFQVIGNDSVIQQAAEAGQLELNVMTPVIAHNLIQSLEILTNAVREFNQKCVKGIKANAEVLNKYFSQSSASATVLNTLIGYEKNAELIKEAIQKNKSVKDLAVEKGIITKKEADKIFSKKSFRI